MKVKLKVVSQICMINMCSFRDSTMKGSKEQFRYFYNTDLFGYAE